MMGLIFSLLLSTAGGYSSSYAETALVKTSADFKDLRDADAKTRALIDKWLAKGMMSGVTEDRFGLNETVSRAELAKILAVGVNLRIKSSSAVSRFQDVSVHDSVYGYAAPYIEALREAGIADGVEFDRFDPAGLVTKEQLAVFMIRGLGLAKDAEQTPPVSDETVSPYARDYVALALMKSAPMRTAGPFNGTAPIRRELLVRVLEDIAFTYCGCGPNPGYQGRTL
jgi:hypothetical protein